ncbi:MAG: hypothetical protein AAGF19_04985 [Pseudomonadota bacterium]
MNKIVKTLIVAAFAGQALIGAAHAGKDPGDGFSGEATFQEFLSGFVPGEVPSYEVEQSLFDRLDERRTYSN